MSEITFKVKKSNIETGCLVNEVKLLQMTLKRIVIVVLLSLFTGGIFILLLSWKFNLRKYFLYQYTSDIEKCTHFLVFNEDGTSSICKKITISIQNIIKNEAEQLIGFSHRKLQYTLPELSVTQNEREFQALEFPLTQIPFSSLAKQNSLLTQEDVLERRRDYGECKKEVEIPSLPAFLLREMTSPFYILQYLSVLIWLLQEYILFACIIISFQFSITLLNYVMTRIFLLKIKKLALHSNLVTVFRSDCQQGMKVQSTELVVGDIIELNSKMDMPCDCILISGEILMNEVSLTGESIPIPKIAINENDDSCFDYSLSDHKKHYLFDGTTIFQLKHSAEIKVLARVVRVGFTSFKGQILRSILYPSPSEFDLMKNSAKFFYGLAAIMLIVFLIRIEKMIDFDSPVPLYWYRLFDTITWIVPPFLPIFESLSLTFSLMRLRLNNIMGVEPQKTLLAGKVTHMCFDKTGTLTTNGITVIGFYDSMIQKIQTEKQAQKDSLQMKLFASCHGVYKLEGENVGDLLDVEMLRFSQYNIFSSTEPNVKFNSTRGDSSLKILNLFEFDSNLQRMSCIAQDAQLQSKAYVFLKGAPEVVKSLCLPESIPQNFTEQLNRLSLKGFRILGLSYKEIDLTQTDVNSLQRTDVEGDLTFLGLLVLENNLKDDTAQCISRLQEGGIECKIISGDNPLTTLQTAGECGILKSDRSIYLIDYSIQSQSLSVQKIENEIIEKLQFTNNQVFEVISALVAKSEQIVVTGNVLEYFENTLRKPLSFDENTKMLENKSEKVTDSEDEENANFKAKSEKLALQLYKQLFSIAKVFSRMRSEQKRRIIEILQKQGIKVGMIGDGANDCEAIKQGDIGISFSSADAALSAPFSSSENSISCVEVILRNGRATMSINIDIFRCLILQGIIKFVGCMIMVQEAQNYGDFQFSYLSFLCGMPFLAFMALSKPANKLEPRLPNEQFHSIPHLISIYSQSLVYSISMIIALVILTADNQHNPTKSLIEQNGQMIFRKEGELNTIIFLMTFIFILTSGSAFFISVPFKLPFYRNYLLLAFTLISGIYCIFMMIFDEIWISLFKLDSSVFDKNRDIMVWVIIICAIASAIVLIFEEMVVKRKVVPWFQFRQKRAKIISYKVAS